MAHNTCRRINRDQCCIDEMTGQHRSSEAAPSAANTAVAPAALASVVPVLASDRSLNTIVSCTQSALLAAACPGARADGTANATPSISALLFSAAYLCGEGRGDGGTRSPRMESRVRAVSPRKCMRELGCRDLRVRKMRVEARVDSLWLDTTAAGG